MKHFCVLPWVGQETQWSLKSTHCCLLKKPYDIEKIKNQMIAGERPEECHRCWALEDQGLTSDRQLKNAALDYYWDKNIEDIFKMAQNNQLNDVLMLKLITSYTCNATCVSCNSSASSSWYQLEQKMSSNFPIRSYSFIDISEVKKNVDFKKLVALSLIGGEPLYEKKNFDLLEHILDLGNKSIFISVVTNGSVPLSSRQKHILSQFKNLNFSVSIDGTERVFEYMRYPLKWNELLANLKFFSELTDNISSNYTLSNLNVLYHNQTVKWFNDNNIPYANNPIMWPTWLRPHSLPESVKQILKTQLNSVDYQTYVAGANSSHDDQNYIKLCKEIYKQDQAKGIKIVDYLPELCAIAPELGRPVL